MQQADLPNARSGADVPALRPAGVLRRAAALVVDLAVVLALLQIGMLLASTFARLALVAQAFIQAFALVLPNAYFVLGHGSGGQTVGKMLMGVRVVGTRGEPIGYVHALGRQAAWCLSVLLFGVGFWVVAVRRDRRALHDLVAGTRAIRAR